jgi:uncharacterized protein YciI
MVARSRKPLFVPKLSRRGGFDFCDGQALVMDKFGSHALIRAQISAQIMSSALHPVDARLALAMSKQHFFCRLIPPRPTFQYDMTDQERLLMQEHISYTRKHFEAGTVLAYGPVLAPGGAFGMAILEVDGTEDARTFIENDPTVRAGMNKFELFPMQLAGARSSSQSEAA